MKTIVLFLITGFISSPAFSQVYVDGVNLNDQNVTYCIANCSFYKKYTQAIVDYGQTKDKYRDMLVRDDSGEVRKFDSKAAFLNFMAQNGWELVSVSAETSFSSPSSSTTTTTDTSEKTKHSTTMYFGSSSSTMVLYYFRKKA